MICLPKKSVTIVRCFIAVLIAKVTIGVVLQYDDYLPPNFEADFLLGRASYFFGAYSVAFYIHIVAGPLTLLLGLALMSERFLRTQTHWHRRLGKMQVVCVLATSTSGLWMAQYAATGAVAGTGFAALAIATATTVLMGWRTAVQRRFAAHRVWMTRCFLLLCSAVVLRLTAGATIVASYDGDWVYPTSAWSSWLVPVGIYELARRFRAQRRREVANPRARQVKPARAS